MNNDRSSNQKIYLGTYQLGKKKQAKDFLKEALAGGMRKFDTAPSYGTELLIGEVCADAIIKKIIVREDIEICDKIDGWQMQVFADDIEKVVDKQLKFLKTDYIDIMLIHWPFEKYFDKTWEGLVKLRGNKIKKIGICNVDNRIFSELILKKKHVFPDVVQIERHPYNVCENFVNCMNDAGVIVQAYSPICRMQFDNNSMNIIRTIAEKYNKSVGQTILRWHIDSGVSPIIKTNKISRIQENVDIFDFQLNENDMRTIKMLNKDYKLFPLSWGCPGI